MKMHFCKDQHPGHVWNELLVSKKSHPTYDTNSKLNPHRAFLRGSLHSYLNLMLKLSSALWITKYLQASGVGQSAKLGMVNRVGWKDTKMPISPKVTQNPVRLSMKNPKSHPLTFWSHPGGCWTLRLTGDGLSHLEVPWEWLFDLKLKIYVKIIHSEHFSENGKFLVVYDFFDFI